MSWRLMGSVQVHLARGERRLPLISTAGRSEAAPMSDFQGLARHGTDGRWKLFAQARGYLLGCEEISWAYLSGERNHAAA